MTLLIAGGCDDPNLDALARAAQELAIPVVACRPSPGAVSEFTWDLETNCACLNNVPLQVKAAFLRHDVFSSLLDPRPQVARNALGWSQAVLGWLHAHEAVHMLNREPMAITGSKPGMLHLARAVGLRIPETQVANSAVTLSQLSDGGYIAKPVAGGDYCYLLEDGLKAFRAETKALPMPAIIQRRMSAPEIRIYIIGQAVFAFEMRSPSLDYRLKQDVAVLPTKAPTAETAALRVLMDKVGMNFGAADFKTDPGTRELVFLELNTSPMFARFDAVCEGALCRAILTELGSGIKGSTR